MWAKQKRKVEREKKQKKNKGVNSVKYVVVTDLSAVWDFVEEGMQFHGLGHQGATHSTVVVVSILAAGQVLSAQLKNTNNNTGEM